MSLPDLDPRFDDLVRELRAGPPQVPVALAERVAQLAEAPVRPLAARRWRLPVLVLAPVCVLVLAGLGASVILGRGSGKGVAAPTTEDAALRHPPAQALTELPSGHAFKASPNRKALAPTAATDSAGSSVAGSAVTPAPAPYRATEEHASFTLQLKDDDAVAAATQKAMRIVRTLGGYVVTAQTSSQPGEAQGASNLTVNVPIGHVQQAIARLGALGRILSQDIQLQDLQASINQQRDRAQQLSAAIAELEHELMTERLTQTAYARIRTQIALDRAQLAAALRARAALAKRGRLATIELAFTTPQARQPVVPARPGQAHRTLSHAWHLLGRELAYVAAGLLLLAPLALLAAIALVARRAWRRREEARLLATS